MPAVILNKKLKITLSGVDLVSHSQLSINVVIDHVFKL